MSLSRVFSPVLHFDNEKGKPLAGGFLCTYLSNTDTPVATYKDASGSLNDVEIELDSRGECEVWLDPALVYKFVLFDNDKNEPIWTKNNISVPSGGGSSPSPVSSCYVEGDDSTIDVGRSEIGNMVVFTVSLKDSVLDSVFNSISSVHDDIESHNVDENAHPDIRDLISEEASIRSAADSDLNTNKEDRLTEMTDEEVEELINSLN